MTVHYTCIFPDNLLHQQTRVLLWACYLAFYHQAWRALQRILSYKMTDDVRWIHSQSQREHRRRRETLKTETVWNELMEVKASEKQQLVFSWCQNKHKVIFLKWLSAPYLHWDPCEWSSSSVGTATHSSWPSCSGSHTESYCAELPGQPCSPGCYPAWHPSPCPRGTGASPCTEGCSENPGCTFHWPGCSLPTVTEPHV